MSARRVVLVVFAALRYRINGEKAYIGNIWLEFASTGMYVVTYIVFIDLLFRRVGTIADYSRNDFLFMSLMGQLTYYTISRLLSMPQYFLVDAVRTGLFDLLLLRPFPTRALLVATAIQPLHALITSVPSMAIICFVINWGALTITPLSVALGVLTWCCGLVIFNGLLSVLAYPVFTQGDATDMLNFWWTSFGIGEFPFDKLPPVIKGLGVTIIPGILLVSGTTQVILTKEGSLGNTIAIALGGALVSIFIQKILWRNALLNYASASS